MRQEGQGWTWPHLLGRGSWPEGSPCALQSPWPRPRCPVPDLEAAPKGLNPLELKEKRAELFREQRCQPQDGWWHGWLSPRVAGG